MDLVAHVLFSVSGIALPFGFSFGVFIVFLWSIPLIARLFKSIF